MLSPLTRTDKAHHKGPSIAVDTNTLLILGVGAALLIWLVFSVLRKLFGLALIAALAFGAYLVWTNPELLSHALSLVGA